MDEAASNSPFEDALDVYLASAEIAYANPAAIHRQGEYSQMVLDIAVDSVKKFINGRPEDHVYFTSGATEGNSIVIQGLLRADKLYRTYVSPMEHNDILELCNWLRSYKCSYLSPIFLEVKECTGVVDVDKLNDKLEFQHSYSAGERTLVVIQGANGEIGTVQPLKEICAIVHKYGGIVMSDMTQLLPDRPVDIQELDVDIVTCSSQKLGGIKGSGFIYIKDGIDIEPVIFGEQGLRGGTPNTPAIAAFAWCLDHIRENDLWHRRYYYVPLHFVLSELEDVEGCEIIGSPDLSERVSNIVPIMFKNCSLKGQQIVSLLSEQGFCISAGSACSNYVDRPSHALMAIGLTGDEARNVIRLSTGFNNIHIEDWLAVCNRIKDIVTMYKK